MFKKKDDNKFEILGAKQTDVLGSLDSGLYTLEIVKNFFGKTFNLERTTRYANTDEPKSGVFAEASQYINRFFTDKYKKIRESLGMLNKLNVIFNGKPGTGKTHLACALAEKLIRERNAIGVVINNIDGISFGEFIDNLRINDDPNRLIVLVLDELEKNDHYDLKNSKFLGFLDGAESRENVIILGTSNNIDDLPNYLINRPGRFEKIWEFAFANEQVLKDTIEALLPEQHKSDTALIGQITKEAQAKELETIDHVRFLMLDILSARELGEEREVAVEAVKSEETKKEQVEGPKNVEEEIKRFLEKKTGLKDILQKMSVN